MPGTMIRWDPFADLADLRIRFDRLLGDLADGAEREWIPAIDMVREDGHLIMRADVPGIKPEDIKIEVDDGVLHITGRHEQSTEAKDEKFLRRERRYGSFYRSLRLPEGVEVKKIKASTHDGVLEVTIPLPKEPAKEKVIITPKGA